MRRAVAALLILALYVSPAQPAPVSAAASSYTFLTGETVARWDPCRVIGWRVRTRDARPSGALDDVRRAFWRLTLATGFRFQFRGYTSVIPQWGSHRNFPTDTQIVVAWVRPWRSTLFAVTAGDAVTGTFYETGWHNPDGSPAERIAKVGVVIDARLLLRRGYGWGITRGDLLLHELGHAMGLGHVDSSAEAMYPVMSSGRAHYGFGDLTGLAERGAPMGCLLADQ